MRNFNTLKVLLETQNLDFEVNIHDLDDGYFKPIYPSLVNNFYFFTDHKDNQHNLKSLENCPINIQDEFYCSLSHISSLKYGPHTARNYIITANDYLYSLQFCPFELENFNCSKSAITSLEYGPIKIKNSYWCNSTKITSLEYAPLEVAQDFYCQQNNIKDLQGIGRKYLRKVVNLYLPRTIESNILGLCLINKLKTITFQGNSEILNNALQIVQKHLGTTGEECAEELNQNGYKDYARF